MPYIPGGVVNPIEIHLVLLLGVWFFSLPLRKQYPFKGIPVWPAFVLFLGTFIFSFLYGIKSGDFLVALWEVRALFYFSFLYLFIPQIITTRKQVKAVMWISIVAITLKALQAIHRYAMIGFSTGGYQTLTNHEDPVFTTTIFVLTAGLFLFGSKSKKKWILLALVIPLGLGFFFGMRRAAYAGLMVSMACYFVILPTSYQVKVLKKSIPYFFLFLVYVAFAIYNPRSSISGPVNMVKSGLTETTVEENPDDYYSNLYRDYENYNLAITIQRNPVIGIGFGNKYDMPLNLANISFPLRDYIPHNEIFWYLIKTGAVGFLMFWVFFNSVAFKGVQVMYKLKDPYFKAVAAMIVLAIINQMVVSYFDLQLTYYRNMIYLGVLTGLLPTLIAIADEEKREEQISANENADLNYDRKSR